MVRIKLNTTKSQRLVSRISVVDELIRMMDPKVLDTLDNTDDIELMHNEDVVYIMKNSPVGVVYGLLFLHGLTGS